MAHTSHIAADVARFVPPDAADAPILWSPLSVGELERARARLAPGGRIYVAVPAGHDDDTVRRLAERAGLDAVSVEPRRGYHLHILAPHLRPTPSPLGVTVVVPARNESGNVAGATARVPVMGAWTEVIFVEGGSRDGTWERLGEVIDAYRGPLRLARVRQGGKGKADAVREGFARARGDILMILDADLTVAPEELPRFYELLASGRVDYAHGTRLRYPMEDGAMRPLNRLGNVLFARVLSAVTRRPIEDALCGTKVLWRADYERIAATRAGLGDRDPFGDFDLLFGATALHLRMAEVPVHYRARTYGETNIRRFRDGLTLARMSAIAAKRFRFR